MNMSESDLTLEMILARPGELDWHPPDEEAAVRLTPESMAIDDVEARAGFSVRSPRSEGYSLARCQLVAAVSSYCADFTEGAITAWRVGRGERYVELEQRRVLRVKAPEVYIYTDDFDAYQTSINGGRATIVIPPHGSDCIPFATWILGDTVIRVFFTWEVDRASVERVLESL
jgi:hypothetical protein